MFSDIIPPMKTQTIEIDDETVLAGVLLVDLSISGTVDRSIGRFRYAGSYLSRHIDGQEDYSNYLASPGGAEASLKMAFDFGSVTALAGSGSSTFSYTFPI